MIKKLDFVHNSIKKLRGSLSKKRDYSTRTKLPSNFETREKSSRNSIGRYNGEMNSLKLENGLNLHDSKKYHFSHQERGGIDSNHILRGELGLGTTQTDDLIYEGSKNFGTGNPDNDKIKFLENQNYLLKEKAEKIVIFFI